MDLIHADLCGTLRYVSLGMDVHIMFMMYSMPIQLRPCRQSLPRCLWKEASVYGLDIYGLHAYITTSPLPRPGQALASTSTFASRLSEPIDIRGTVE